MVQSRKQPPSELPAPFGRYRLHKLLGQGGMGSVYLAHDSQLDRPVALKIPQLDGDGDSQVLTRFYREARSAAALHHPNICPIHDVGEVDGIPYLTMAYIEGKPLGEYVEIRPPSPRQSAVLVRKLALALQEAHRQKIIHRDLKPANIMIDKRGEPIIMDFGLAQRNRKGDPRVTQEGRSLGTPAYMPPEQINGELDLMGPGCDIYSLGVVFYELLAGRLPFQGDVMTMLCRVLQDEPPPPSEFRPDLDPELEAICLKAMAKKVADRYASMTELALALQEYLQAKPGTGEKPAGAGAKPKSAAPANEAETQPAGILLSQMGGLRSVAQLHANLAGKRAEKSGDTARTKKRKRKKRGVPWWAWAGGAAALVGLIAWVVYSTTNYGSIQIDLDPAAAQVEIQIDGEPGHRAGIELRLAPGPHQLIVTGKDYETAQQTFRIERGRNPNLKVTLKPIELTAKLPIKPPPDPDNKKDSEPDKKKDPAKKKDPDPKPKPNARAETIKQLDALMLKYLDKIGCSAAALAVDRDGVPFHIQAYGAATRETQFAVGHFRNPLIQASVRKLAEKKAFNLNDPILPLLKVVPLGPVVDQRVWAITVENVLQQRTGWNNEMVDVVKKNIQKLLVAGKKGKKKAITFEVILAGLATLPLKEAPGTKVLDCDFCFDLGFHLLAKAGKRPGVFFRNEVLGRHVTGISVPGFPKEFTEPPSVFNAKARVVKASAPAVLELMRGFSGDGLPGHRPGWLSTVRVDCTCHFRWRQDGVNVAVLFNGSRDNLYDEIVSELQKVLKTVKSVP